MQIIYIIYSIFFGQTCIHILSHIITGALLEFGTWVIIPVGVVVINIIIAVDFVIKYLFTLSFGFELGIYGLIPCAPNHYATCP